MAKRKAKAGVVASSGNVFRDLGVRNAEGKADQGAAGRGDQRDPARAEAVANGGSEAVEGEPAEVSALANYQLEGFSVERLMNFLTALDRDVDIVIRRRPGTRRVGRIVVRAS